MTKDTSASDVSAEAYGAPSLRARHLRVVFFFARLFAGIVWWDVVLRRIGLRALARRTAAARYRGAAHRFRLLAAQLGGVWIKVGQFLSSRVDVLPESVTDELSVLQDEVAPEALSAMTTVVEAELGGRLEDCFAWFDPAPLASASLGQVHRARLPSGEAVVVKVQRPRIQDLLRVDLAALRTVVGWLKRYPAIRRRADLDALFEEFSRTLWEEVDYLAEADHARRFAEMFATDPAVRIPRVHQTYTTRRVLTLEDVYFIKITDYAALEAAGVDRAEAADRLFRTYLRQIFSEGFFHADPHPGNLFAEPRTEGWRLVFVDFGMVGRIAPQVRQGLRDLAIAVGARDLDRLMRAYQELNILLPGADLQRIRQAEAAVFDRLWGKSMRELTRLHPQEMRQVARQFRDVLYEMPFQLPRDLVFLGRCVAILSGMCTGLNPDFNLFEGLAPFAHELLAEEAGGWLEVLLEWLRTEGGALMTLPQRLSRALDQIERGELLVTARAAPDLERQLRSLTGAVERLVAAVVVGALLLAGTALYIGGERLAGGGMAALAALALVVLALRRR
ncbi:MAG: AarF/UbiB family protein [Chloroflexota bacterium]